VRGRWPDDCGGERRESGEDDRGASAGEDTDEQDLQQGAGVEEHVDGEGDPDTVNRAEQHATVLDARRATLGRFLPPHEDLGAGMPLPTRNAKAFRAC
jgi:hypothetical protein